MDVTRTALPGMTPHLAYRMLLRAADDAALTRRAAVAGGGTNLSATTRALAQPMNAPEINGPADGPDILLPTGVRIRRKRIGSARVGDAELQQAIRGVQLLPVAHQNLIARLGLPIELVPVVQLERMVGKTDPIVGATAIEGPDGSARPTRIRIAAYQAQVRTSVTEATQHEIGHAIAVQLRQDTSEATAMRYAQMY